MGEIEDDVSAKERQEIARKAAAKRWGKELSD
jgi:hypothetical protein